MFTLSQFIVSPQCAFAQATCAKEIYLKKDYSGAMAISPMAVLRNDCPELKDMSDVDALKALYYACMKANIPVSATLKEYVLSLPTKFAGEIQPKKFFKSRLWTELVRKDKHGVVLYTVTCTEDNVDSLYNSQFPESTVYGQVFHYN